MSLIILVLIKKIIIKKIIQIKKTNQLYKKWKYQNI